MVNAIAQQQLPLQAAGAGPDVGAPPAEQPPAEQPAGADEGEVELLTLSSAYKGYLLK